MRDNDHWDFEVRVKGQRACFTMPMFGVERRTYPFPTPSAMRGLLEAVFWRPEFRYEIARIGIVKPGHEQAITRTELQARQSLRSLGTPAKRTLRTTSYLLDVEYLVQARILLHRHAEPGNTHRKYLEQLTRRLTRGAHFQTPYLGLREFAAEVSLSDGTGDRPSRYLNAEVGPVFFDQAFIPDGSEMSFKRKDADGVREVVGRTRPLFFDMRLVEGWVEVPRDLYDDIQALEARHAA